MKNRKRFTAFAVAAALTFSMVSSTGSMVLAEDDTSMEAVESDTSAEELVSDTDVSANDDNSAVTDESLSDSSEEVTESIENSADESSENDAAESEYSLYSTMMTSEEANSDTYTLSLEQRGNYGDDSDSVSVGDMITYVLQGTYNGESITDFSDYMFSVGGADAWIADANISSGILVGTTGISYFLDVTGLMVGTTPVYVQLLDKNGAVLATTYITVTVNETVNEETYYTIEIDEDSIYPGKSLPIKLTRVDITSTEVISTDVSDKITSVYVYNNNDDYEISELFSVSGSTAEGWYVNVLDYGLGSLIVNYSDGDRTGKVQTWLTTTAGSGGVWVTPEQFEYTVEVGKSITIEFDTIVITVAKDGSETTGSYTGAYTVDATESYNGLAAYEYCSIECSDKNVTITGLKEGSADITIAMYTPGYVGDDKVSDKQLTIHVVSADSSTGTETTEPETTEPETTDTEKSETEKTETETTETASTETNTTVAGVTETGTAETSATEAASTESTTETESESETEDPSVETGDNSPIEFYIAVMLLAMAIMVTGTFERRMRRN